MSTEEQRAIWRKKSQERRDKKNGLPPPGNGSAAPEFLTVETQRTYVIAGSDDTSIALTRDDLERLYKWWKAERKTI